MSFQAQETYIRTAELLGPAIPRTVDGDQNLGLRLGKPPFTKAGATELCSSVVLGVRSWLKPEPLAPHRQSLLREDEAWKGTQQG